ncbi:hypothetical protein E4U44_005045 [Claviceps purpurea]|nr:hypothetical protein E4U49_004293 [Claviceps purpurea]KAG6310807.1 hypothetical protein E4U44_005045 [Claviceps purpurea]
MPCEKEPPSSLKNLVPFSLHNSTSNDASIHAKGSVFNKRSKIPTPSSPQAGTGQAGRPILAKTAMFHACLIDIEFYDLSMA